MSKFLNSSNHKYGNIGHVSHYNSFKNIFYHPVNDVEFNKSIEKNDNIVDNFTEKQSNIIETIDNFTEKQSDLSNIVHDDNYDLNIADIYDSDHADVIIKKDNIYKQPPKMTDVVNQVMKNLKINKNINGWQFQKSSGFK